MTFDEQIKKYKELSYESYGLYAIYDNKDIYELIEELKQVYAPTIEMTAKEKEQFLSIADSSVIFTNFYERVLKQSTNIKLGIQASPELYKNLSENELMNAWLHPETIKVVY